jgi:hypothetical protein
MRLDVFQKLRNGVIMKQGEVSGGAQVASICGLVLAAEPNATSLVLVLSSTILTRSLSTFSPQPRDFHKRQDAES